MLAVAHAQEATRSARPPYGVIFEVVVDAANKIETLRVSNVVPLRQELKGRKSVDIPDSFIAAVHVQVDKQLQSSAIRSARTFYTYYFFDPELPTVAIGRE